MSEDKKLVEDFVMENHSVTANNDDDESVLLTNGKDISNKPHSDEEKEDEKTSNEKIKVSEEINKDFVNGNGHAAPALESEPISNGSAAHHDTFDNNEGIKPKDNDKIEVPNDSKPKEEDVCPETILNNENGNTEEIKETTSGPEHVTNGALKNDSEHSEESKVEQEFIVSLASHLVSAPEQNSDLKPETANEILPEVETKAEPESIHEDVKTDLESVEEIETQITNKVTESLILKEENNEATYPEILHPEESQPINENTDNSNERKPEPAEANVIVKETELSNTEPQSVEGASEKSDPEIVFQDPPVETKSEVTITLTNAESEINPKEEVITAEPKISEPEFISSLVAHRVPIVLDDDSGASVEEIIEMKTFIPLQVNEIEEGNAEQALCEDEVKVENSHPEEALVCDEVSKIKTDEIKIETQEILQEKQNIETEEQTVTDNAPKPQSDKFIEVETVQEPLIETTEIVENQTPAKDLIESVVVHEVMDAHEKTEISIQEEDRESTVEVGEAENVVVDSLAVQVTSENLKTIEEIKDTFEESPEEKLEVPVVAEVQENADEKNNVEKPLKAETIVETQSNSIELDIKATWLAENSETPIKIDNNVEGTDETKTVSEILKQETLDENLDVQNNAEVPESQVANLLESNAEKQEIVEASQESNKEVESIAVTDPLERQEVKEVCDIKESSVEKQEIEEIQENPAENQAIVESSEEAEKEVEAVSVTEKQENVEASEEVQAVAVADPQEKQEVTEISEIEDSPVEKQDIVEIQETPAGKQEILESQATPVENQKVSEEASQEVAVVAVSDSQEKPEIATACATEESSVEKKEIVEVSEVHHKVTMNFESHPESKEELIVEKLNYIDQEKKADNSESNLVQETEEKCTDATEKKLEVGQTEIGEKGVEKPQEDVHIAAESPVIIVEQTEETLEAVKPLETLPAGEEHPKLDEPKQTVEEEILTDEKSAPTPNTKTSESSEIHTSTIQEKVEIKDDGAREVVKDEIKTSELKTKISESNEQKDTIKNDNEEVQVTSFTKFEASSNISKLSEKKMTTTTTSYDITDAESLREIINSAQGSNQSKDNLPEINPNQKLPLNDDGEIIIKLSSSSETTTSRSLSKETSQSTTKTSSTTTGIESKPWAPVAPTSQSSTTEISTKSFVTSFEKSEEISHQKSKPETPKPRAKKSENQVQVVEPEPPAKPERHLKPDTTATKPEAATPKLAKKEPEIKPVKSKVTQATPTSSSRPINQRQGTESQASTSVMQYLFGCLPCFGTGTETRTVQGSK